MDQMLECDAAIDNPDGEAGPALVGRKLTEFFFLQFGIRAMTQHVSSTATDSQEECNPRVP